MQAVQSKNTGPEMVVRRYLHAQAFVTACMTAVCPALPTLFFHPDASHYLFTAAFGISTRIVARPPDRSPALNTGSRSWTAT
jgi:hypothetical protein